MRICVGGEKGVDCTSVRTGGGVEREDGKTDAPSEYVCVYVPLLQQIEL